MCKIIYPNFSTQVLDVHNKEYKFYVNKLTMKNSERKEKFLNTRSCDKKAQFHNCFCPMGRDFWTQVWQKRPSIDALCIIKSTVKVSIQNQIKNTNKMIIKEKLSFCPMCCYSSPGERNYCLTSCVLRKQRCRSLQFKSQRTEVTWSISLGFWPSRIWKTLPHFLESNGWQFSRPQKLMLYSGE